MAFRRTTSFRGRSRFRFRRGSRLNWNRANKPTRWQMGNFHITQQLLIEGSAQEFFANVLATPSTFLPNDTADRRQITQAIRRIEVGGLVYTHGVDVQQHTFAAAAADECYFQQLLTINRLDSDGNAIGIDFPWGSNNQPVSNQPAELVENRDEPVRILDRSAASYVRYVASNQESPLPIYQFRRSRSLRLKVPIGDSTVLAFTTHATAFLGSVNDIVAQGWITGTIYYRYRW